MNILLTSEGSGWELDLGPSGFKYKKEWDRGVHMVGVGVEQKAPDFSQGPDL